jgi:hypothetical protein
MEHKDKVKMARKMSKSKEEQKKEKEIKRKKPIFETDEWDRRKKAKLNKQLNQGKKLK